MKSLLEGLYRKTTNNVNRNVLRSTLKTDVRGTNQGVRHENGKHLSASLYVHWPYCLKRCTYCNFNKYISRNVDDERMMRCLVQEIETLIQFSGVNSITSVFFGGGTPSLAKPQTISAVLNTVQKHCKFTDGSEVTLEVNPTTIGAGKLREFKDAGINRLSIGVQSLYEEDLKVLGRDHSVNDAKRCITQARDLFPGRVSFDVIFARPHQTLEQWKRELHEVLPLCDDHISLYQLTLERGTQLFKWVEAGITTVPDEDTKADMYNYTVDFLEKHGFERYEVSNFARNKAYSTHNQSYWDGRQYLGVGPGAHGRFTPVGLGRRCREARIQTLEPENWMYEVEKYGHGTRKVTQQKVSDRLQEVAMLGMRTKHGIPFARWIDICPFIEFGEMFMSDKRILTHVESGLLKINNSGIKATRQGLSVVDSIIVDLLHILDTRLATEGIL